MGQVIENTPLIERQHFILRRLNSHEEITDEERKKLEEENEDLERKIAANLAEHIALYAPKIRTERPNFQDMKKNEIKKVLAHWLKELLKDLDENTRNGVFRAAYKGKV